MKRKLNNDVKGKTTQKKRKKQIYGTYRYVKRVTAPNPDSNKNLPKW